MQVVRAPFDLNVPFTLKRVDPSLADVAIRSNEVAVDGEFGAHLALRKQDVCIAPKDSTPQTRRCTLPSLNLSSASIDAWSTCTWRTFWRRQNRTSIRS